MMEQSVAEVDFAHKLPCPRCGELVRGVLRLDQTSGPMVVSRLSQSQDYSRN